jgi:hypothetical protein
VLCFLGGITTCYAQKTAEAEQVSIKGPESARNMSIEEQKKEAYDILKEILLLSNSPSDNSSGLLFLCLAGCFLLRSCLFSSGFL